MGSDAVSDFATLCGSFPEYRERLLALAERNLNPVMRGRVSPEDVVQETFAAACRREEFFVNRPEVPVYFKLRMILLQTLTSLERKHLQARKRDAFQEQEMTDATAVSPARLSWNLFADTMTGPMTSMARSDRYALLRQAVASLSEDDARIIELRNFDGLSNRDCAEILGVTEKNASIRYVRALRKLKEILVEYTEFKHE